MSFGREGIIFIFIPLLLTIIINKNGKKKNQLSIRGQAQYLFTFSVVIFCS